MASPSERYRKLGIGESLPRIYRYPIACKELSFILRGAYNRLPKNLQSLIFDDTLAAFRLLPRMSTHSATAAANSLAQAAEAALPKQKRSFAATEFKHAKIAQKKHSKVRQEEIDCAELPQDVLVHILSFLDFESLVSAGLVCWSWNLAAGDDSLWQAQYSKLFGYPDTHLNTSNTCSKTTSGARQRGMEDEIPNQTLNNWRDAFKTAFTGKSSKKTISNRGYCRHCKAIVWLNYTVCSNKHPGSSRTDIGQIKHVQPHQVVSYLLGEFSSSDSESDSDDEGHAVSRLWAYSKAAPHPRS